MLNKLLDILAPEDCIECHQQGSIWCDWCRLQHEPLPSRCFGCHAQTAGYEVCKTCRKATPLKAVYVYGEYKNINKEIVKSLKFGCKRHAASPIAKMLSEFLPYFNEKPMLIPVPSAPSHVRQRGFDHTLVMTRELSDKTGLPIVKLLVKTNDIRQVGSSRKQRLEQIKGSFRLKKFATDTPEHVILIDDVVTTGATLSEAARVLKQNGVKRVDAAVFAYSK